MFIILLFFEKIDIILLLYGELFGILIFMNKNKVQKGNVYAKLQKNHC